MSAIQLCSRFADAPVANVIVESGFRLVKRVARQTANEMPQTHLRPFSELFAIMQYNVPLRLPVCILG